MAENVIVVNNKIECSELSEPLTIEAGAGYVEIDSDWNQLNGGLGINAENRDDLIFMFQIDGTMPAGTEVVVGPKASYPQADEVIDTELDTVLAGTATDTVALVKIERKDYLDYANHLTFQYRFKKGATPYTVEKIFCQFKKKAESQTTAQHHALQYAGEIYYVDPVNGNDTNLGKDPDESFKTINKAISVLQEGDMITLKAGLYTENGIDLNVDKTEIKACHGVIIAPTAGTGLTVSGNFCNVKCETITVNALPDEAGVVVTGSNFTIEGLVVNGNLSSYGFRLAGDFGGISDSFGLGIKDGGMVFDVTGDKVVLTNCGAAGQSNCYGFHINNNSSYGFLDNCLSVNNGLAGYYFSTGVSHWTLKGNCISGQGDGKWIDVDASNIIGRGFSFDSPVSKHITFTTTGAQSFNLFKVFGNVEVLRIYGNVEEDISSNMTGCHLEVWDGTASQDISKFDGIFSSLPQGSLIIKTGDVTKTLQIADASAGAVLDEIDTKKESMRVIQKTGGVDTFIRFEGNSTDTPPTGKIHWYCHWFPLDSEGFVTPV